MPDLSPALQNLREALERYKAVTKTAADRAQAALVLVTAASLERLLRDLLKASMRTMGKKKEKQLFQGYGPLSSLSAKIDLAYFFKSIDRDTYLQLHTLRELRNRFAHAENLVDLSHPEIKPVYDKLKKAEDVPEHEITRFFESVKPIEQYLKDRITAATKDTSAHVEAVEG